MGIPIVPVAMQLMVSRFCRIDTRCADDIERYHGLFCQLVPQLKQPLAVDGAESANDVVFVCLDGPLSGVYTVVYRLNTFPSAVLDFEEGLYQFCCLVDSDIDCRLVTLGCEVVEKFLNCFDDGVVFKVFD